MKGNRIIWIDYLKIIACLMVFIGHYYDAFFNFCLNVPNLNNFVIMLFEKFPAPYFDGNFWVCVFCILSGFLATQKKICSFKELIKETILRYFRFLIPLFFINVFVYLLDFAVGFKSIEFALMYNNNWLDNFFKNITLDGLFKNTLTFGSQLNGPLWMIRPLFIGNILVLSLNYLNNKLKDYSFIKYLILIIMLLCLFISSIHYSILLYSFVTFLGVLVSIFNDKFNIEFNLLSFTIALLTIHVINIIPIIEGITTIYNISFLNMISAILFILVLFCFKNLRKIKKSRYDLGSISFYTYLVHWPIICTLSCSLILLFNNYTLGYVTILVLTIIIVLVISYICSKILDKIIERLNNVLKKVLCIFFKV